MQRPQARITVGTVLVRSGTEFPLGVHIETTSYSHDWEAVDDSGNLDARLHTSGWNLFFIAGSLRATCLGVSDTSLRKGISRLIKQIQRLDLNSIRVTHIVSKKFLGIPYRILIAHPCHVQQGCFLPVADKRKERISQRASLKLIPAHGLAVPSVKATETN